jgi:hypothetical protein
MFRDFQTLATGTIHRRSLRAGFSMFDLLVSFTLLTAAISVVTPLVVRHGHLLRSHRNYRLALDELSNQMERLTALPPAELATAVGQLAPSPFIAERLPGAELAGKLEPVENGSRVTLTLQWKETSRESAPVTLAAWVFSRPPAAVTAPERAGPEGTAPEGAGP